MQLVLLSPFHKTLCSVSLLAVVLLAVSQNMRLKFTARGLRCVYVMPKYATVTKGTTKGKEKQMEIIAD